MKKDVVSIRFEKRQIERLEKLSREQHKEKSALVRELVELGFLHLMIKQYEEGKISIGKLAHELGVPVIDAIDILTEYGVESPVEYSDFVEGLKSLK